MCAQKYNISPGHLHPVEIQHINKSPMIGHVVCFRFSTIRNNVIINNILKARSSCTVKIKSQKWNCWVGKTLKLLIYITKHKHHFKNYIINKTLFEQHNALSEGTFRISFFRVVHSFLETNCHYQIDILLWQNNSIFLKKNIENTIDPWTTQFRTVLVHLYVDFPVYTYSIINVFSL